MNGGDRQLEVLRRLAAMPFLDRLELAAVTGLPDRSAYHAVAALERKGLAASLSHATSLLRTTRRYYLTAAGLGRLADSDGAVLDDLLRSLPVSSRWRNILLQRLDAVAVIYRLTSAIAALQGMAGFRWYRGNPLDCGIVLPGGRTIGIVRQGHTTDRTGFAKRLWRLRVGPYPSGVLLLFPDGVRLRHARRLLATAPFPALLALERDVVGSGPEQPVWQPPSVNATLGLREALSYFDRSGGLPGEAPLLRATAPGDIRVGIERRKLPDSLLPALLKPAEKRALDLLSDWPWIASEHLQALLGVSQARLSQITNALEELGLLARVFVSGHRLVLTDRGLALLARRDRASVGAARKRWSAAPRDRKKPLDWRNVSGRRSRQLLRNIEHTGAVHWFIATLARQARASGWEVVQLDPPHRASRHFRHGDRLRSIQPDAFGILRKGGVTWPFFLEWERRAVRPTTMAARLAPYLRYYSSQRPTDDHGAQPTVLVVFDDDLAASQFLGVARTKIQQERVDVPLLVSHAGLLSSIGPLGSAWHTTDSWETFEPLRIARNKVELPAAQLA